MADFSIFSPDGVNMLNVKDVPARNMVTDAFSTGTAYAVGDYCIYDGVLYICTTAHEGAWTSGDFAATTIAEELKNAGGGSENSHKILQFTKSDFTDSYVAREVDFPHSGDSPAGYGEIRLIRQDRDAGIASGAFNISKYNGQASVELCSNGPINNIYVSNTSLNISGKSRSCILVNSGSYVAIYITYNYDTNKLLIYTYSNSPGSIQNDYCCVLDIYMIFT